MVKTAEGTEVYENQIETLFVEYFENDGIDPIKAKIKQGQARAAFIYIYNTLFKPDRDTIRLNNRKSKIDYRDIWLLWDIYEILKYICNRYGIVLNREVYSTVTGISTMTLSRWSKGESRGYVYYDLDGNEIHNINEYKANGKEGYKEIPSTAYCDLVKNIDFEEQLFYKNGLSDTPFGQTVIANNDERVNLNYARREAQAKEEARLMAQVSMQELAKLRESHLIAPEKPEI